MKEIPNKELNNLFMDTLRSGSSKILAEDSETIEYELFEQFDVGIISFLHEKSLNKLLVAGFITEEIKQLSLDLRKKAVSILQQENRNFSAVKRDKMWEEIFNLSDKVLCLKESFDKSRN
jgi:hypothetical protein